MTDDPTPEPHNRNSNVEQSDTPDAPEEAPAPASTPLQPQHPPPAADEPDEPVEIEPRVVRRGGLLAIPVTAPAVALTVLMTALFLMFLLIEPTPRWLVLFGSAVAALSMDGVLRSARREPFDSGVDTTPYLFLPAMFVLATPVFVEHNVRGFWALAAAAGSGLAFGAVAVAQIASVREFDPARGLGRFISTAATYFVAFALFSLTYRFGLDLQQAMAAAALVSVLLSVEILREGEIDPLETLVFAVVTALVVAEVRWTLHFLPIDGYLAGLALLLAFYFVTGVLHSHLTRHLNALVAAEYVVIAGAGVALVAGARAAGIA